MNSDLKFKDVVVATKFFVNSLKSTVVDENSKVIYSSNHKPVLVPVKDNKKEVYILSEHLPKGDYWVYNPFSGSLESNIDKFFYMGHRVYINTYIVKLITSILYSGLLNNKIDVKTVPEFVMSMDINKDVLDVLSKKCEDSKKSLIDDIDLKAYDEIVEYFENTDNINELFIIKYDKNRITSELMCDLLGDEIIKNKDYKMRKKSLCILRTLIRGILGTDDLSELSVVATEGVPFKFYSTMSVCFKLHQRINMFASGFKSEVIDEQLFDLDEFQQHLDNAVVYKSIVRHIIHSKPTDKSLDTEMSVDTRSRSTSRNREEINIDSPRRDYTRPRYSDDRSYRDDYRHDYRYDRSPYGRYSRERDVDIRDRRDDRRDDDYRYDRRSSVVSRY